MSERDTRRTAPVFLAGALGLAVMSLSAATGMQDERPELNLRARPEVSFAPTEISFVGLLHYSILSGIHSVTVVQTDS